MSRAGDRKRAGVDADGLKRVQVFQASSLPWTTPESAPLPLGHPTGSEELKEPFHLG